MNLYKKVLNKLSDILWSITAIECKLDELVLPYYGIVTSPPVTAPTGDDPVIVMDTTTGILYYWNGVSWNVASGDTHMGNTDLVFTGPRTYSGNGYIYYNDVDHMRINTIGAATSHFRNDIGATSAAITYGNARVDIDVNDNGDVSNIYIAGNSIFIGNAYGVYYLGDGFFTLPPTLDDVTPDYDISIDSTTGRLYRTTKVADIAKEQIGITIDGGGAAITTGYKGRFRVPYSGTITGWTMIEASETPITTTSVVDVKLGTYANYDTTPTFTTIAGSEKPTITTSEKGQDLTLTTWTTAVTAGDFIEYTVDSNDNAEKLMLFIDITKS
jgi:hypothetical protein